MVQDSLRSSRQVGHDHDSQRMRAQCHSACHKGKRASNETLVEEESARYKAKKSRLAPSKRHNCLRDQLFMIRK